MWGTAGWEGGNEEGEKSCDATWRFPFCLEATVQREREGGEEKAGGAMIIPPPTSLILLFSPCLPLLLSLSTFSLSLLFIFSHPFSLFPSPTLPLCFSLCKRGSCLSVFDLTCLTEMMKWRVAITLCVFKLLLNYPSALWNRDLEERKLQYHCKVTYVLTDNLGVRNRIIKYCGSRSSHTDLSVPRHTLRKKRKRKGKCWCVQVLGTKTYSVSSQIWWPRH